MKTLKRAAIFKSKILVPEKTRNETVNNKNPQTLFTSFNLTPEVLIGIQNLAFLNPSPIQESAIPAILSGSDVLAQAKSGSGKTAAFCIGIAQQLIHDADLKNGNRSPHHHPRALIMVPTRELALQIQQVLSVLIGGTRLRTACCYGGKAESSRNIISTLSDGVDIVIGTPGRILDMIRRHILLVDSIKHLVLDEADQMFSMGLKQQLISVHELLPRPLQVVLFSATIPTDLVETVKQELTNNPVSLLVKESKQLTVKEIDHYHIEFPAEEWKFETLVEVLRKLPPSKLAVVFCNRRDRVEALSGLLHKERQVCAELPGCLAGHGDMPQRRREAVMKQFFSREKRVLICSDLWSRGVDIQQLDLVINYDMPEFHETYVHRVGRSGRYGRHGVALSLVVQGRESTVLRNLARKFGIILKQPNSTLDCLFE